MAHIWQEAGPGDWRPVAIADDGCSLTDAGPAPHPRDPAAADRAVWLRRVRAPGEDAWALLASPSVRPVVNGIPVSHGIVALSDRDEIRLPPDPGAAGTGASFFFSTERLATIEPYPDGGRRGSCPRCKRPLTSGEDAVKCPACGLWHHATDEFPCWTYDSRCAACQQPTALDAGFQWTPEEL